MPVTLHRATLIASLLSFALAVPCPGREETRTWVTSPTVVRVPWRIDAVCTNSVECFGREGYGDSFQLCPVYIQLGDSINMTLPMLSLYELSPAIG